MIDDLDLGFEDAERGEKGRHRRGAVRKRQGRSGGGRGKTIFALLMALVLLGGIGGGAYIGFDRIRNHFVTPDYDGPGTGEALVEVKAGDTLTDIGNTLYDAGVVKSTKAFIEAADANSRSKNIQVGRYKVRKQMKAADAVIMLLDPKNRVVNGVTIPEGTISLTIYDLLAKQTKIPVAEFKAAAKDPVKLGVPAFWFNRTDGKKGPKSVEGFLYPATYEIPPKATAEQILSMMVEKFLEVTGDMKFVDRVQKERGISPYEALIAASIAQAESVNHVDMPKVARVIYNRVYTDKYHCRCLEIDSAINYWLRLQGKNPKDSDVLKQSEIHDLKNPYNTHDVNGLMITPISNPGEEALKGAMDPPPGNWIYFMTIDKKGTMGYGSNDADFRKLQKQMCDNGVLTKSNCA
ncbi:MULTISPECIES: endolytic transglycosylase MltG [Micromonospora]|uniref:Endolytic murein transglycosylase n=1 Tax=Micromonospora solifontis TaxID=2487138 RepID=A0ABX9WJN0_9ACTN|nr:MULTISPECIES: endolytic transglycosylase MltG [Micromonospora]NES13467.1 endolytic transglycosylase MltG [Micromonospora sp. PPF5-17B]NES35591.1 endolytic transglycosylase MltG [Micromonospora solifontis]NES55517.1 endolytic transglycosylase MltG [Micromonospora sp. PPF5-6]RNM00477.1 endolytic transglycosylase MltG [Micromonospora solifontis]